MQNVTANSKFNTHHYKDDAKQALNEGIPKSQYSKYRSGLSRISIIRKIISSNNLSLRDYRDKIIACMPGTGKTSLVKTNNAKYRKARIIDFDFGNLWKIEDLKRLSYPKLNNIYGKITKVLTNDPNDSLVLVNTPLNSANIFVIPLPDSKTKKMYLKRIFDREGCTPFYKLAEKHFEEWVRDWADKAREHDATIIYVHNYAGDKLTHLSDVFLPSSNGQYKYLQWIDSNDYNGLTHGGFIVSL